MNRAVGVVIALFVVIVGAWAALVAFGQQERASRLPTAVPNISSPAGGEAGKLTRSDKGEANVNVSATYMTGKVFAEDPALKKPDYDPKSQIVFLVAMNTHVVDLSTYKLDKLAVLAQSDGSEVKPLGPWISVQEAMGHHRSGYLKFKRPADGPVTLIIKAVGGVPERRFTWDAPLP